MTWWQVAAAVPLVGVAAAAAGYQRLGLTRDLVTAAVRAAAQLAAVGAVLLLLFAHAATAGTLGWIAVMLLIAGQVAGRRGRAALAHHALFDTTAHRLRTPETTGGPGRWTIRGVVRR
jgi:putative ABC transport system permease protein